MEFALYLLAGLMVLGALATLAYLSTRSRRTGAVEPQPVEQPRPGTVRGSRTKEEIRADVERLLDSEAAEGTAKIDRAALRALAGGESSAVEEAYFLVIAGEGIGRFIKLDRDEFIIGREPGFADIVFRDDAISKQHAKVRLRNGLVEIEDLGSSNGTFVDGKEVERATLKDGSRVLLGRSTVLTLTFQDRIGEQFQQRMYESSTRDRLTDAYNKATFLDQLASEMHFARRHGTNYYIVILDIDHFKAINDTHGHLVGDEILAEVGRLIRSMIRGEAMFVRYGGEEFIVAERNADATMGGIVAERIRSTIEKHAFETAAGVLHATVSLGVADLRVLSEVDGLKLVEAADTALYRAKSEGRNRVCIAKRDGG